MVLQSDNGLEFSGTAMTSREHRGFCVGLSAEELNEVINEIKLLWLVTATMQSARTMTVVTRARAGGGRISLSNI